LRWREGVIEKVGPFVCVCVRLCWEEVDRVPARWDFGFGMSSSGGLLGSCFGRGVGEVLYVLFVYVCGGVFDGALALEVKVVGGREQREEQRR
jgi:hypothetical protein